MIPLIAVFTLLSILPVYLSLRGRWRIGILLGLSLSLAVLWWGFHYSLERAGLLSSLVFFALAAFPVPIRAKVRKVRKSLKERQKILKAEIHDKKIDFEEWVETKTALIQEMDQIYNRYALARGLVSYVEGRSILQELGTIFSSRKNVVGLSFFKLVSPKDPAQPGEEISKSLEANQETWISQHTSGWVSETDWKKILQEIQATKNVTSEPFVVGPFRVRFPTSFFNVPEAPPKSQRAGSPAGQTRGDSSYILVGVPVKWDGRVRGLLVFLLNSELPKHFMEEVSVYAQLLGLGLHKVSLYQLMIERGRRDGLTNLYLRRVFLERLNEEISFTKRYGYSFSLLLLDLDNFKKINDTYGHPAGDKVLKAIAGCLKSTLHSGVTISRYGGEEFAVLIGLAPQPEVMKAAEKLREAVENLAISLSETVTVKVTVSIGVAHYLPDSPSFKDFIERADTALYWAKNRGKNRVCEWRKETNLSSSSL